MLTCEHRDSKIDHAAELKLIGEFAPELSKKYNDGFSTRTYTGDYVFSRDIIDENDEDIGLVTGRPLCHIAKYAETIQEKYIKWWIDSPEKPGTRLWLSRRVRTMVPGKVPEWHHMSREAETEDGES